eukprot:4834274-Pyramimonas_sp.AAC.1
MQDHGFVDAAAGRALTVKPTSSTSRWPSATGVIMRAGAWPRSSAWPRPASVGKLFLQARRGCHARWQLVDSL